MSLIYAKKRSLYNLALQKETLILHFCKIEEAYYENSYYKNMVLLV